MIRRLNLYLFRQILTAFVFSTAAVSFVVLFAQSFRLLSFIIENAGTAVVFLQLMGLLIPTFLPVVAPIALGVGVLFIYHKLAIDSELVVIESAGISPLRLGAPALALAGLVTFLGLSLTTWLTPAANRAMVAIQYRVKNDYAVYLVRPGTFNDLAEGLTFFARGHAPNGGLRDILVHDVRKPDAPVTIMAETGRFQIQNDKPEIIVFHGKRQELDPETGRLSQLAFDRYTLDLQLLQDKKAGRLPDPREQTMAELMDPPKDPKMRRTSLSHIKAEIHQRLATPLLAISYTLIALAAILAGEFNRRGMAKRLFGAGLSIVALQAVTLSLVSLIGRHPMLTPLLYLAVLAPVPFCLFFLGVSREGGDKTAPSAKEGAP